MKPGAYVLSRDVVNPYADRRHKHDWRRVTAWKAGNEFVVVENHRDLPDGLSDEAIAKLRETLTYYTIRSVDARWSHLEIGPGNEAFETLVAALVPCEESTDALFARLGAQREHFAKWLVESSRMSRQDFETSWHAYQYGEE